MSTPKKKGKRNSSFDAGSLYSGVGANFHGVGGNIGNTADNNARAKASKAPKPTFTPGPAPVKPPWAKSAKQNAADMGKPQGSLGDQIASMNPLFGAAVESGRSVTRLGKLASYVVQNDLSTNTKAKDPYEQAGGGESWGQMGLDLVNVLPVGKVVGAVGKKAIEAGEHLIAPTITVHAREAVNAVSKGFNTAEKWLEDLVHDAPDAATPRGAKINPTTVEPKTLAPTRTKPITKPFTRPGEKPIKKPGEQPFTRPTPGPAREPKPYHDPTKPRKPPKKPIPKKTPIPKETPVPAVPTPGPTIKPVVPPIPPKPETTPAPKKTPVPVVPPVVPTPAPTKSPVPKRTGEPIIPKPTKSPAPTPSVSPTPSRTATPKPTIKPEILPTPSPKTSRPSAPERSASPQPSVSPSASASATTPVIPPLVPLPGTAGTPEDPGNKLPPPPPEFPEEKKPKPKPHLDLSVGQQQLYVPRIY